MGDSLKAIGRIGTPHRQWIMGYTFRHNLRRRLTGKCPNKNIYWTFEQIKSFWSHIVIHK